MSRKSSGTSSKSQNDSNEKNSAAIREFQSAIAENKKCFECDQRGPTYVDMTIGSFVCTKCSGMLRGITPPHRIKSISMSSFTAEEVNLLKSRGNFWCSKVWMGLYDKSRSVAPDSKDEDGLKYHIIQKYEKKSYYVDPSQIQQTLTSIQHSNAEASSNSSTATGSGFGSNANTSGGFIGTTLNQRNNANFVSRPTPSPVSVALPHSSPAQGAISVAPPSKNSGKPNGNPPNFSHSAAITGIVLPPPVVDPFSSNSNFPHMPQPAAPRVPKPTPPQVSAPPPVAAVPPVSAPPAVSNASNSESFANFDTAQFDSVSDPWSSSNAFTTTPVQANASLESTPKAKPPPPSMTGGHGTPLTPAGQKATPNNVAAAVGTPSSNAAATPIKPMDDKYSALKELDEIFKSTVVMSDGNSKSTGTSLFGSSPLATQSNMNPSPIMNQTSVFGPSPTNFNAQSNNGFEAFPTAWSSSETKPQAASNDNRGFSPSWVPNWGSNPSSSAANQSNAPVGKAPINPFTGATNLTQLNTSPWPTTGTSPVANNSTSSASAWPPASNSAVTSSAGSASSGADFAFGNFANFNSSQSNDPFGAAPASNIQRTENNNNNDLFAKAPKPIGSDQSNINALAQDFFGNSSTTTIDSGAGGAFNPWASPSTNMNHQAVGSIFASESKPNPTNPFL